jgi:redox-sensitive bicupin YhaK (pirin superfamily)
MFHEVGMARLNDGRAEFVQIWFLPPEQNLTPDYQNIILQENKLTTVLSG